MSFAAFIIWLHLLGAAVWIGGLTFLMLAVGPALTHASSVRESLRLELMVEGRCRAVMWPAVGLVLFTGLFNVINILYATSVAGGSLPPAFAHRLTVKISLVVLMVILQAVDQLVVRPKRIEALKTLPLEAGALPDTWLKWQRLSKQIGLVLMSLAVIVMFLGVILTG